MTKQGIVCALCFCAAHNMGYAAAPMTNAGLQFENDAFALRTRDGWYTNGLKFNWVTNESEAPNWLSVAGSKLPFFDAGSPEWWGWSLQQQIFTPEDIDAPEFPPDDRPYAGWLNLNFSLANLRPDRLERIHLGIGITGEASLAEEIQEFSHELLGTNEAIGWDTQLPTELTLSLAYDRQWRLGDQEFESGYQMDWAPHAGLMLGNALTKAEAGLFWRFGRDFPDDFGPPRITALPDGAAYFRPRAQSGWYFCIGANVSYVAHNLFLDGATFEDSPSVESSDFVGEAFAGYVYYLRDFRISYVYVRRSKEFENQDQPQNLAAITFTWAVGG
jgi:lipid A 3-O-deacylase